MALTITSVHHCPQRRIPVAVDLINHYLYVRPLSLQESSVQLWFIIVLINTLGSPGLCCQSATPPTTVACDKRRMPNSTAGLTVTNVSFYWYSYYWILLS